MIGNVNENPREMIFSIIKCTHCKSIVGFDFSSSGCRPNHVFACVLDFYRVCFDLVQLRVNDR